MRRINPMANKTYVEVPCVLLSLIKETNTGDDIEMTVQMSAESAANAINTALALVKAWKEGPEALKAHYDKQLKEIETNGVLDWINDRRTNEAKRERSAKTRNRIRKEFPDTRGHYEY